MVWAPWDVRQRQVRYGTNEHSPVLVLIVHAVRDHLLGKFLLGEARWGRHTAFHHGAIVGVKGGQHTKLALVERRRPLYVEERQRGQCMAPLPWRTKPLMRVVANDEGVAWNGT